MANPKPRDPAFQYVQRWAPLVPMLGETDPALGGLLEERDQDLENYLSTPIEIFITGGSPATFGPYVPMARDMILTKVVFRLQTAGTTNTLSSVYVTGGSSYINRVTGPGVTETVIEYDNVMTAGVSAVHVEWNVRGTGALGWSATLVLRPAGELLT